MILNVFNNIIERNLLINIYKNLLNILISLIPLKIIILINLEYFNSKIYFVIILTIFWLLVIFFLYSKNFHLNLEIVAKNNFINICIFLFLLIVTFVITKQTLYCFIFFFTCLLILIYLKFIIKVEYKLIYDPILISFISILPTLIFEYNLLYVAIIFFLFRFYMTIFNQVNTVNNKNSKKNIFENLNKNKINNIFSLALFEKSIFQIENNSIIYIFSNKNINLIKNHNLLSLLLNDKYFKNKFIVPNLNENLLKKNLLISNIENINLKNLIINNEIKKIGKFKYNLLEKIFSEKDIKIIENHHQLINKQKIFDHFCLLKNYLKITDNYKLINSLDNLLSIFNKYFYEINWTIRFDRSPQSNIFYHKYSDKNLIPFNPLWKIFPFSFIDFNSRDQSFEVYDSVNYSDLSDKKFWLFDTIKIYSLINQSNFHQSKEYLKNFVKYV
jgi:hypothetical protein